MKATIKKLLSMISRRPIIFEKPRTEPVSRQFGFDRRTPIDRYLRTIWRIKAYDAKM
jgi:hypothetical protein